MQPRPAIRIDVHECLPREAADIVDQGLGAFNDTAAPLQDVRSLGCCARDEAGAVIGSFQAPDFYRRLGYETALAIEGFAPGIVKYAMVRQVREPDGVA